MAGVEAVTSKPSHTNSPSALPRRAQTFGLRFAFLDETETEKQETKAREVKNERNKGVTHEYKMSARQQTLRFLFPTTCQHYIARLMTQMSAEAKQNKSGGYSRGVPPLPIPNREVKPTRADGTAPQCGRVGRRRL